MKNWYSAKQRPTTAWDYRKPMNTKTTYDKTSDFSPWRGKITALGASLRDRRYLNKGTSQNGLLKQLPPGTVVNVVGQQGVWLSVWVFTEGKFWTGCITKNLVIPIQSEPPSLALHVPASLKKIASREIAIIDKLSISNKTVSDIENKRPITIELPMQEFLTQKSDGSLHYTKLSIKINLPGYSKLEFNTTATIRIIEDKPLEQYEQELIAELKREENRRISSGRADESYIIFELIFIIATRGQSSMIGRYLTAAAIIKTIFFPSAPSPTGHVLTDAAAAEVIKSLWTKLFRKICPLGGELAVGILSESSAMTIGTFRESSNSPNPKQSITAKKLDHVRSFWFQFSKEQWNHALDTPIWLKDPNYNRQFWK